MGWFLPRRLLRRVDLPAPVLPIRMMATSFSPSSSTGFGWAAIFAVVNSGQSFSVLPAGVQYMHVNGTPRA